MAGAGKWVLGLGLLAGLAYVAIRPSTKYRIGDILALDIGDGRAVVYGVKDIITLDGVKWYVLDQESPPVTFRVEVDLIDHSALWSKWA